MAHTPLKHKLSPKPCLFKCPHTATHTHTSSLKVSYFLNAQSLSHSPLFQTNMLTHSYQSHNSHMQFSCYQVHMYAWADTQHTHRLQTSLLYLVPTPIVQQTFTHTSTHTAFSLTFTSSKWLPKQRFPSLSPQTNHRPENWGTNKQTTEVTPCLVSDLNGMDGK